MYKIIPDNQSLSWLIVRPDGSFKFIDRFDDLLRAIEGKLEVEIVEAGGYQWSDEQREKIHNAARTGTVWVQPLEGNVHYEVTTYDWGYGRNTQTLDVVDLAVARATWQSVKWFWPKGTPEEVIANVRRFPSFVPR